MAAASYWGKRWQKHILCALRMTHLKKSEDAKVQLVIGFERDVCAFLTGKTGGKCGEI